jgi:hypothetical protein
MHVDENQESNLTLFFTTIEGRTDTTMMANVRTISLYRFVFEWTVSHDLITRIEQIINIPQLPGAHLPYLSKAEVWRKQESASSKESAEVWKGRPLWAILLRFDSLPMLPSLKRIERIPVSIHQDELASTDFQFHLHEYFYICLKRLRRTTFAQLLLFPLELEKSSLNRWRAYLPWSTTMS